MNAECRAKGAGDSYEKLLGQSRHSTKQEHRRLILLVLMTILLLSIYPLLARSTHIGSADFHATIEIVGAFFGLLLGFALITRFYTLGGHFYLFVGLAFFVNGVEDLIHGLLSYPYFQEMIGFSASSLDQLISGTYITGRLMLGMLLILAPYMPAWLGASEGSNEGSNEGSKNKLKSTITIVLPITAMAFQFPLLQIIHPGWFTSSSVYFLSTIIFTIALFGILKEYHRGRDTLTWWISLAIAVSIAGQVMMTFSRSVYDPFFNIAHVYKVLGYVIPLFGLSLYLIAIIAERKLAEEETELALSELDQIFNAAADGMRVIDKDFNMLRVNETFLKLVGLDKNEVIGKKCYEVFYDPLCLTPECPLSRILCDNDGRFEFEVKKERKDGKIIPCILMAAPFFGPDGRLIGIIEDFKDISELKRPDNELSELINNLDETNEKLKESHDELNKFVLVITNNIRDPLEKMSALLKCGQNSR